MKRICLGLLFAVAVIAAGTLTRATESGAPTPLVRTLLTGVIGILIVWRIADFWQRHRGAADQDPAGSADTSGSSS